MKHKHQQSLLSVLLALMLLLTACGAASPSQQDSEAAERSYRYLDSMDTLI